MRTLSFKLPVPTLSNFDWAIFDQLANELVSLYPADFYLNLCFEESHLHCIVTDRKTNKDSVR